MSKPRMYVHPRWGKRELQCSHQYAVQNGWALFVEPQPLPEPKSAALEPHSPDQGEQVEPIKPSTKPRGRKPKTAQK